MNAAELLTATYCREYCKVSVTFFADGSVEFAAIGNVDDSELVALAEAQGGNVDGWKLESIR